MAYFKSAQHYLNYQKNLRFIKFGAKWSRIGGSYER